MEWGQHRVVLLSCSEGICTQVKGMQDVVLPLKFEIHGIRFSFMITNCSCDHFCLPVWRVCGAILTRQVDCWPRVLSASFQLFGIIASTDGLVNKSSDLRFLRLIFSFPVILSWGKSTGCGMNFHLVCKLCSIKAVLLERTKKMRYPVKCRREVTIAFAAQCVYPPDSQMCLFALCCWACGVLTPYGS